MPSVAADGIFLSRRIRHVSSIRVCNFTPFPMRDAVTSALAQPVEPSQLNALGHLADDINILSRRRSRKLSATSTNTKSSSRQEDEDNRYSFIESRDPRSRRVMTAGVSEPSPGVSDAPRTQYGSPQSARRRRRTNSVASSMSGQAKTSILFNPGASVPVPGSFSVMIPDISQQGLEKAIASRLIETFLTITILSVENQTFAESSSTGASSSRGTTSLKSTSARRTQTASISSLPTAVGSKDKSISGATKSVPSKLKPSHSRSSSSPMYQHHDLETQPSTSNSIAHSSHSTPSNVVPDFFSQVHPPSVNPTFSIDARPGHDFSPGSNSNGSRLKIQLWGRTKDVSTKVVGKQKQESSQNSFGCDWSITQEWVFSLDQLLPLPPNASSDLTGVPPNTLLVTLNPPGNTYYLSSTTPASPPSPICGYFSDSEFSSKRAERDGHTPGGLPVVVPWGVPTKELSPHSGRHSMSNGASTPKHIVHTTAYQQLFELVNLQSLIQDHERTLSGLIQKTDKHFEHDIISPLQREIYECQHRIDLLQVDSRTVIEETAARKKELELRRHRLEERRQSLVSARILEETNISDTADLSLEAEGARERLTELHAKIGPIRVGLLSILASIYPIELYSPPDLLYTILGVPLPIPLMATEPAPPLSLPNHSNVNEDGIATALGYVAQLLHFLAMFLGKALIYPVTCVGSRSFIKDGISAMVGPRLFPLFSKGVDTYRFEYGVFLLNKNIEMLMVDRDLQALDMRHTLPNLKNLVLTVTHGETVPVNIGSRAPPPDSPALSMLDLDSPTEAPSTDVGSTTPRAAALELDPAEEASTPSASGSTTPTVTSPEERKSRPFLGLSFSELLRGRYTSVSRPSGKAVPEGADTGSQQASAPVSTDTGESEGSNAHDDEIEDDIRKCKAPSGEIGDAQNRNRHHEEAGVVANKFEEAASEPGAMPVHVH